MTKVSKAVVEAGLVDEETLREMRRWGLPVPEVSPSADLQDQEAVLAHVREAIESPTHVRVEETELDLMNRYLDQRYQKQGRLILKEGKRHQTISVAFCLTLLGEYAIPWTDADSPDVLANGETHLKWEDEATGTKHDVYFSHVREVSFGDRKAFAVCEVNNDH